MELNPCTSLQALQDNLASLQITLKKKRKKIIKNKRHYTKPLKKRINILLYKQHEFLLNVITLSRYLFFIKQSKCFETQVFWELSTAG